MQAQPIGYYKKPRRSMHFKIEALYTWLLGLISGGIAYLNGAPSFFLGFSWAKASDLLWAFLVALFTGIGGMVGGLIGKYIYNSWLKKFVKKYFSAVALRRLKQKWFPKKK